MATEGDTSDFGPAWWGWEDYGRFAESVKTDLRYVRSRQDNDFLAKIRETCGDRKVTIPQGSAYWRAQLGCEYEPFTYEPAPSEGGVTLWSTLLDRPYNRERMKPVPNWQTEGRANPRGIPFLYLATTQYTAQAEVRPWTGSKISVAQFRTRRDLNVIDCSRHYSKDETLALIGDQKRSREDGIWMAIDQAFAAPVARDEDVGEYVPTQIIAELFKHEGFDGIVYKSLLSESGFNLALFSLDDANVVSCALHTVASISFDFQSSGAEYFVSDDADSG